MCENYFHESRDCIQCYVWRRDVKAHVALAGIKFMFLVGGFADSPMLQSEVRNEFQHVLKVVIPNEVSLAVLRGQAHVGRCNDNNDNVLPYLTLPFLRGGQVVTHAQR